MKILVVDDHVLFAEAIQQSLIDREGHEVSTASDAEQALEVLDDAARRPDVVLMDVGLPDRSGISLGAEMLDRWPDVRIIALTALNDAAVMREAMQAGFHGFLTKDAQLSRVVNAIHTVRGGEVVMPLALARAPRSHRDDHAALLASSSRTASGRCSRGSPKAARASRSPRSSGSPGTRCGPTCRASSRSWGCTAGWRRWPSRCGTGWSARRADRPDEPPG